MNTLTGDLSARGRSFAVVCSRFNEFIVDALVQGSIDTLIRHGADQASIDVIKVPGAFELPLVVKKVAKCSRYDAVIALGAVIRGSTPHFDYVAGTCARGIAQVALEEMIPVTFGVLTVDTIEQAIERSGAKAGNKGSEAAACAIEMVNLMEKVST